MFTGRYPEKVLHIAGDSVKKPMRRQLSLILSMWVCACALDRAEVLVIHPNAGNVRVYASYDSLPEGCDLVGSYTATDGRVGSRALCYVGTEERAEKRLVSIAAANRGNVVVRKADVKEKIALDGACGYEIEIEGDVFVCGKTREKSTLNWSRE